MLRANQGLRASRSQSAKTSRGSRSADQWAGVPSGKTAAWDGEFGLNPQQIAPLHCPVVRELLARQQPIYQHAAFVRVRVQEELPGLMRRGQSPDHVQKYAPHKNRVRAHLGGWNVQAPEIAE